MAAPGHIVRKVGIMSENSTAAGDLASQYAAQVTGDLERNAQEQERIGADIAALQEQLAVLRRDQAVLVSMREALGAASAPAGPPPSAAPPATVPGPRTKAAPGRAGKGARAKKKTAAAAPKPRPKRASEANGMKASAGDAPAGTTGSVSAKAAVSAPKAAAPTLVELVRAHLAEQGEPRSAAEVTAALGRTHADRPFKTTVVRNTLENLVARGQAQRGKQGSSVFYTAPDTQERHAGSGASASAGADRPA